MQNLTLHLARESLRPVARLLAAGLLALGLAACGPGTGGTGTGPVQGVHVFSSATLPTFSPPGAACAGDCGAAQLRLTAEAVELTSACVRFTRSASWSADAAGLALVDGTLETQDRSGQVSQPGTLRMVFAGPAEASESVTLTLADARGQIVLGPVTLSRQSTLSSLPAACPR